MPSFRLNFMGYMLTTLPGVQSAQIVHAHRSQVERVHLWGLLDRSEMPVAGTCSSRTSHTLAVSWEKTLFVHAICRVNLSPTME